MLTVQHLPEKFKGSTRYCRGRVADELFFYESMIYGLLEFPDSHLQVFTARYRVKFLQLVDVFLASSMIPAYSAAAFAKKFARLSVSAPPNGALACLAFVHNLIRRHPSCMCLLHRPSKHTDGESLDPFDMYAPALDDSKGVESSLWELGAARTHVDPTVCHVTGQHFQTLSGTVITQLIFRGKSAENSYWNTQANCVRRLLHLRVISIWMYRIEKRWQRWTCNQF